jgi:glyoxylase-like metal-dependent hydrolase (beta-lactamase superfamily II)
MADIYVFQTGSTIVSPAVPDRSSRESSFAYTGLFQNRKKRITVPVKCFLVEAAGHRILIDTGWSAECAVHPLRHLGFGLWFASEPLMRTEESAVQHLKQMNLQPSDIDAILLTHLDCDHVSGLIPLKEAAGIYVTKEELDGKNLKNVRYHPDFWKGIDFSFYEMKPDERAPFGKSCDLFDDGSVVVYFTPSHSAGSVAIEVNDGGRFALFTGDNGYNRHSWEELRLPGPVCDLENMTAALEWVQAESRRENCAGVYAAHDPEVRQGKYKI